MAANSAGGGASGRGEERTARAQGENQSLNQRTIARLPFGLSAILKMWREPRTTFHGLHFHIEEAILEGLFLLYPYLTGYTSLFSEHVLDTIICDR